MTQARFQSLLIQGPGKKADPPPAPFSLDLSGAVIKHRLNIEGVVLEDLDAKFLTVEGPMHLKDTRFNDKGGVNLEHSSLNILRLCGATLPENSKATLPKDSKFKVYGMTYRYISWQDYNPPRNSHSLEGECGDEAKDQLVELANQAQFKPSVYTDLEAFFKRQGYSEEADKVFIQMKTQEREEVLKGPHWLWNWFLHITVNHGRNPEWAFVWGFAILLIGLSVFRNDRMRLREAPDPEDPHPKYNAFWYSFDLFLPVVDLHVASVWVPKNSCSFALLYMRLHILLGFILIPIGLAAFTGIIS